VACSLLDTACALEVVERGGGESGSAAFTLMPVGSSAVAKARVVAWSADLDAE
jgi:hypothetical protein